MKRDNLEKRPKDPSGSKGWEPLRLHPAFPGPKEPLDTDKHPDRHTMETPHRHGTPLNTEHQSISPVNKTFHHIKDPNYKGTTVTDKKTYHG